MSKKTIPGELVAEAPVVILPEPENTPVASDPETPIFNRLMAEGFQGHDLVNP